MRYYHKTDVKNVKSILKKGLITNHKGQFQGRIYLCRQSDMDMGLGHALFAVDIPDDHPDLNDDGEGWQVIAYIDIPPEYITYLGEYEPNQKYINSCTINL